MFVGFGTVVNIAAIVIGSGVGVVTGAKLKESTRDLVTDVLGFITLLAAGDALISLWHRNFAAAMPKGWTLLTVLAALIIGALLGSALNLEIKLERFGVVLKNRLNKSGKGHFVTGFVSASLLFAIGPLAILGSISDGMGNGTQQLVLKSTLDFFTSIAFASSLGWGVAASAIPVGIYQFIWTGIGFGLGGILTNYQIDAMTATGGVLLLGISFRLLKIKQVAVGNLLPALFLAPIIALIAHAFQ